MSYTLKFTQTALDGLEAHRRAGDKAIRKKIRALLDEIAEHPFTGTGQPEPLKHNLSGFWSRRINREHRIVYAVDDGEVTVTIISTKGHY